MFPLKSITALLFKWEEMVPRLKRVTMSTYQGILVINYAGELLFIIIIFNKKLHILNASDQQSFVFLK